MKKEFYLIVIASILSAGYGLYSTYRMLFNNQTPYTLECTGMLLDRHKVYAISNYERTSEDTVFIHYEQAKVIAPSTLGYIYYDTHTKGWILENHACVFNPEKRIPENYFLPFCLTQRGETIFFDGGAKIPQGVLVQQGIKYNTAVGTPENRISLEFVETPKGLVLNTKDDGIRAKYLVKSESVDSFGVYMNTSIDNTICPRVFSFDNSTTNVGRYTIIAKPHLFDVEYTVKNENGRVVSSGKGNTPSFFISEFQFAFHQKYSLLFAFFFVLCFAGVIVFQIIFLRVAYKSPLIQALLSVRILLNCLLFTAIPLFLTSYYLAEGRGWYLFSVLLLNATYFIRKDLLTIIREWFEQNNINSSDRRITILMWVIILGSPILFYFATTNEKLWVIPILHCVKGALLLLFFATQNWKNAYIRNGVILGYAFSVSFLTGDFGSFIYVGLALCLIALIRKFFSVKQVVVCVVIGVIAASVSFLVAPETLSKDRKMYRFVAAYVNPSSDLLASANQADRESYSYLMLNLKNVLSNTAPAFNDVIIPGSMRSTCHSDYAFHWSLIFGGIVFFCLYLFIVYLLLSKLLFLLYCSIRSFRVQENVSYTFPKNKEAELIRFLLSLTIVGLVYPMASNTLLIPLTGQAIPLLSISTIEVFFLIILLIPLENIFGNTKYYGRIDVGYTYGDMKQSMRYGLFLISAFFIGAIIVRSVILAVSPKAIEWKKTLREEKYSIQLPNRGDSTLVEKAKALIGNDALTSVDKRKKSILKNLASLYYTKKLYTETVYESKGFRNSTDRLKRVMSVDSLFHKKKIIISGDARPYGTVYAFSQEVNNNIQRNVSHSYYRCIPSDAPSTSPDLTAECNERLEKHLAEIGLSNNIGAVMIVDNRNGAIVVNASYPFTSKVNSNEVYYFIGSLKKTVLAYCALVIDANYKQKRYGNKSFEEFIKFSDDYYAASLLKELLELHQQELNDVLMRDFGMPLYSITEDAFLDAMPTSQDFRKELDKNNPIYRQAIGQQRPYTFTDAVQWYARISSQARINLNYSNINNSTGNMSIPQSEHAYLKSSLNTVLTGTAYAVGRELLQYDIDINDFIAKTGTAQKPNSKINSSSSFIIANPDYTIGIMLRGSIPENREKLAAKDAFCKLIPTLIKYQILYPRHTQNYKL